jgi:hypothetical protein
MRYDTRLKDTVSSLFDIDPSTKMNEKINIPNVSNVSFSDDILHPSLDVDYFDILKSTEQNLSNWLGKDFFFQDFFETYEKRKITKFHSGNYSNTCKKCEKLIMNCDKYQTVCESCCNEGIYPNWLIPDAHCRELRKEIKKRDGILIDIKLKYLQELTNTFDDLHSAPRSDYVIDCDLDFEILVNEVKQIRTENNF